MDTLNKEKNPLISVVTVSYNQGHFLEETIKSVLTQNYSNIEYLIIDGGSTDNSVEVIKKYSSELKYWISEKDRGPSYALAKGLSLVSGEIVFYLNSDDFILPNTFKKVSEIFNENPEIDVIYGNGFMVDENSKLIKPIYSNKWSLNNYLNGYVALVQQSTFFRRAIFEKTNGVNVANSTCWDGEMWVDMSAAGAKFKRINDFWGCFRVHSASITGSQKLSEKYLIDTKNMRMKFGLTGTSKPSKIYSVFLDPIVMFKRGYYKMKNWYASK